MNYQMVDGLNDLSGHFWLLDDLMIFCARYLIFVAFAVFAVVLVPVVRQRSWATLVRVAATLGLSFVFGLVAAQLYVEPRPFTTHHDIRLLVSHAAGQSFPSDHATASFAMGVAVLFFVSKKWGWLLVGLATVIGFARVYTGVHYVGDILGSVAVVLLAVAIVEIGSSALSRRGHGRLLGTH
jgi:undecaprenyl-diphosphatase